MVNLRRKLMNEIVLTCLSTVRIQMACIGDGSGAMIKSMLKPSSVYLFRDLQQLLFQCSRTTSHQCRY